MGIKLGLKWTMSTFFMRFGSLNVKNMCITTLLFAFHRFFYKFSLHCRRIKPVINPKSNDKNYALSVYGYALVSNRVYNLCI